jgi:hypothetical protein
MGDVKAYPLLNIGLKQTWLWPFDRLKPLCYLILVTQYRESISIYRSESSVHEAEGVSYGHGYSLNRG